MRFEPTPEAAATMARTGSALALAAAMSRGRSGVTLGRVAAGVGLAGLGVELLQQRRRQGDYTITVAENSAIFDKVLAWVNRRLPADSRRAVRLVEDHNNRNTVYSVADPGGHGLSFEFEGGTVEVGLSTQGASADVSGSGTEFNLVAARKTLVLTCPNKRVQQALTAELTSAAALRTGPQLYIANTWGGWTLPAPLPPRPVNSVTLRGALREDLLSDARTFLDSQSAYHEMGLPWHRGYLFYGPPGTGKTSFVLALANALNLDLYFMSLSDLDKDARLLETVGDIRSESLLLLEDIDVVHATRSRDDAESRGVSLSGLLNALDGVATPNGLITVMTTNHVESLDEALLRPGRVDRKEEFGFIDDAQLAGIVSSLCASDMAMPPVTREITPADIVAIVKANIDDRDRMVQLIAEFVRG